MVSKVLVFIIIIIAIIVTVGIVIIIVGIVVIDVAVLGSCSEATGSDRGMLSGVLVFVVVFVHIVIVIIDFVGERVLVIVALELWGSLAPYNKDQSSGVGVRAEMRSS